MWTTEEERQRLRKLLEEADGGVWKTKTCVDGYYAGKECLVWNEEAEVVGVRQVGRPTCRKNEANAKLIAEMHNKLGDLLDEIDHLEALVESQCR